MLRHGATDSGTGTVALMLALVAMAGGTQALCSACAVGWCLAVAASAAFWAVVLVLVILLGALGASAGDVAGAVVLARALAVGALVALQTLCSLLSGLLGDLWVDSSHSCGKPACLTRSPASSSSCPWPDESEICRKPTYVTMRSSVGRCRVQ